MWKWSIEHKVVIALACAAAIPVSLYGLIVLTLGLVSSGSDGAWMTLFLLLGDTVVLVAILLVLRHAYLNVRRHHDVEQRLQSTNRFLESLLDNIPTMIFAKDAKDLRFLHFNRAGEKLLGHARGELIGKSDRDFFPPEQVDAFLKKDREVLAHGGVIDIPEEEIDTHEGRRILHTRKVPVRDAQGKPLLLLGISMDVTEQKANERRILGLVDDLKRHAAMLESSNQELESFCYSVSHDLRAPLRAINGYTQLLQQQYSANWDGSALRSLERICHASEHMAKLIDDLLEFSRLGRQSVTTTRLDMSALVARVIEDVLVQHDASRPAIDVQELLPASGDQRMLQRVWVNLLDNAVKYSAGMPEARITVGSTRRNGNVVYFVGDNGVGFDMRYYEKIFGVFQRLHGAEEFPGTGVGLAIVQRILSRHGGDVWAKSEPGNGATFYFSLPEGAAAGGTAVPTL